MRAPFEHMMRVTSHYEHDFETLGGPKYPELLQNIENSIDQPDKFIRGANHFLFMLSNQIVAMHGLGHPIEAVKDRLQDRIALVKWVEELTQQEYNPMLS